MVTLTDPPPLNFVGTCIRCVGLIEGPVKGVLMSMPTSIGQTVKYFVLTLIWQLRNEVSYCTSSQDLKQSFGVIADLCI